MGDEIRDYKDLVVWKKSMQLAKEVYCITKQFPSEERFGLTIQIRRAVVSVSSNIAEGHSRQGREFAHFVSIARGSLAEVESQMILAHELGFVSEAALNSVMTNIAEIKRMAASLTRKLRETRDVAVQPLTPNP